MKTKSQPMRTCVGCGEPKSKRELMRVALSPGQSVSTELVKPLVVVLISVHPWTVLRLRIRVKN